MTFNHAHARILSMCLTLAGGAGCASLSTDKGSSTEASMMASRFAPMVSTDEQSEVVELDVATAHIEPVPVVETTVPTATKSLVFYPKWAAGTCANDGRSPYWGRLEYDNADACCTKHFAWKHGTCMQETGAAPRATFETPASTSTEVDSTTIGANDGCPAGWTPKARDCSSPDARAMHCENTLPKASSRLCSDGVEADHTLCLRSQERLGAEWCVKPTPSRALLSDRGVHYGPRQGNG